MSKRPLSNSEESILALGLGLTSITETEVVATSLDDESAARLRSALQSYLTDPKLLKSNMTKGQKLGLKKLKEDKDIVILPADKGNATVVLNK